MVNEYAVFVEGLDDLSIANIAPSVEVAAYRAINKTADYARSFSADDIRRKINFPGNYLDPSKGRLIVSRRAQKSNLEAVITARRRSTSLARFMVAGQANKMGVVIEMKKGQSRKLEGAFPVRLNGGADMGLAVRTTDGQKPANAYKPSRLGKNLWLLYGVSVSQAFAYSRELTAESADIYLSDEFNRLLDMEKL